MQYQNSIQNFVGVDTPHSQFSNQLNPSSNSQHMRMSPQAYLNSSQQDIQQIKQQQNQVSQYNMINQNYSQITQNTVQSPTNSSLNNKTIQFRNQIENSRISNPKSQSSSHSQVNVNTQNKVIETNVLLQQLEKLEQNMKHKQPNASIIESKSSLSQKNAQIEEEQIKLSLLSLNLDQQHVRDKIQQQYLLSYSNNDYIMENQQSSNIDPSLIAINDRVLMSQTSQASKASNYQTQKNASIQEFNNQSCSVPDIRTSPEQHQFSTFQKNHNELMEDINVRSSVFSNASMKQIQEGSQTQVASVLVSEASEKKNDSAYSSFSDVFDGHIKICRNDVKYTSHSNYKGLPQIQTNSNYQWVQPQSRYAQLYKFPILINENSDQNKPISFSKCNKRIDLAIQEMFQQSYFKKGEQLTERLSSPSGNKNENFQHQNQSQKVKQPFEYGNSDLIQSNQIQQRILNPRRRQNGQSFQSEDVLDTLEEMAFEEKDVDLLRDNSNQFQKASSVIQNDIDQAIENSLNKSNITMEDNNKATKQRRRSNQEQNEPNRQIQVQEGLEEQKTMSFNYQLNSNLTTFRGDVQGKPKESLGRISPSKQIPINHNEKVFELRMDEFNNDTSFDTLTSDRLFQTQTEDNFPLSSTRQANRLSKQTSDDHNLQNDSIIETELKKINKNLNTFTVEHFNNLRDQIQKVGFYQASQKAKREFNLITAESINTMMSIKDEDNDIFITEESRAQNKFQNLYANSTTASKNLYQINQSQKLQIQNFQDKIQGKDQSNPLLRKIVICEQSIQRNHTVIEILHSVPCSGFMSSPSILYSSNEKESVAFIDKNQKAQFPLSRLVSPATLYSMSFTQVAWISCGYEHCMVLTNLGQVASWGFGASGCLGHGDYVAYLQPKYINQGEIFGKFITYIDAGGYHNSAIDIEGNLYMWGRSDVGQLGLKVNQLQKDNYGFVSLIPQQLKYFENKQRRIKQVALGEAHSIALDHEGAVYSFGWNNHSQLGFKQEHCEQKAEVKFAIYRIQFFDNMPCSKIASGSIFSVAITEQRTNLYIWGSGSNGQLGLGNIKQADQPTLVEFPNNSQVIDVNCGDSNVIALLGNSQVYGWGEGITNSNTIIKDLRESMSSQNFSSLGVNQEFSQYRLTSNPTMNQYNLISSLPKQLKEVDIAHTFLIKKRQHGIGNIQNHQLQVPLKNNDQQNLINQKKGFNYAGMPRNLPSNNTICEVSEKDSDYDEKSKILRRNGQTSTMQTCHSSLLQNAQLSQSQISSSLSKFANQDSRPKIEMIYKEANKFIPMRSQSPQVQDVKIISQDIKNFGNKKGSVISISSNNPLSLDNIDRANKNQDFHNQLLVNSQTVKTNRVNRNDIISKLEEFTHSNIMKYEQQNDSSIKQYNNMTTKNGSKNQIKNLNIQTSMGARNHGKLQIQTSNSILESQSSKRIKHITSVGQIDLGLNSSQNLNSNTYSNNSSRLSQRDSDQLQKPIQTQSQQNKIKRVRSPQPDQLFSQKIKGQGSKKQLSPKKVNQKGKNVPTPKNNLKINNLQTYSSQSILSNQIQHSATSKVLNTHAMSTRNKNIQLKTTVQNTSQSDMSFKKTIANTTSQQNLQLKEALSTSRLHQKPIQTLASPTNASNYDQVYQKLQSFATTTKNTVSQLLSPSRMLQKASLHSGVISLNDTTQVNTTRHQKKLSINSNQNNYHSGSMLIPSGIQMGSNGSSSVIGTQPNTQQYLNSINSQQSIFNFNDKTVGLKPRGPKIGMTGSGQQNRLGNRSAKVSPKSNRNTYI
eukprot:403346770